MWGKGPLIFPSAYGFKGGGGKGGYDGWKGGYGGGKGGKGMWVMIPDPYGGMKGGQQFGRGPQRNGHGPQKTNKKRKAPGSDGPPRPLDEDMVQEIAELIQNNGGSIQLGRISTLFEGVKKVQMEEHFLVEESSDGDYMVSLSDMPMSGGLSGSGRTNPKPKKAKKEKAPRDPDAPPPPALDESVVAEITEFLESNGGQCKLGKLATQVEGLKKAQLEGHFELIHGEKDTTVRLLDADERGFEFVPEDAAPAKPVQKFVKKEAQKAVKNEDEEPSRKKQKKDKRERGKDAPPPEPLSYEKLGEIGDWLNEMGGSAKLGQLTTKFSGVKKAQLEESFVLEGGGAGADPIVKVA